MNQSAVKQSAVNLIISYFRGVKRATIPITPLTLIAGHNHAGKSSIAAAAEALLTGKTLPDWCKKKDARDIVNVASGRGTIELVAPDGSAAIEYPAAVSSTVGAPPHSSQVAVGDTSPVDLSDRERAGYFAELLGTEPTADDLRAALADAELTDAQFAEIWDSIRITGWDAAHKRAAERGAEAKGAWQHVTNEQYGKLKAANWRPVGWCKRHDDMIVGISDGAFVAISEAISALKAERDEITGRIAVSDAEMKRLREYAEGVTTAQITHDANTRRYREIATALSELKTAAPAAVAITDQDCPHCGKPLRVNAGQIVAGGKVTKAHVAAAEKALAEHDEKVADLAAQVDAAIEDGTKSAALLAECTKARDELAAVQAQNFNGGKKSTRTVDQIDAEIESHEADRDMVTVRRDAAKYHTTVERNAVIVAALAPDGVRKTALERGLGGINASMAAICAARWATVELTPDLNVTFGGRDYRLLSQSEQYRVRATVQIACALIDGSAVLVFDGADILDRAGRQGLVSAVMESALPGLVCMTYLNRDDMPDLSTVGGLSVWIEAGEVSA